MFLQKKIQNPYRRDEKKGVFDLLLWLLGAYRNCPYCSNPPKDFLYPFYSKNVNKEDPQVCWVNHSTFVMNIDGLTLLTDPIWEDLCSPFSWIGPKRKHSTPFALQDITSLHMVFISHNHYDHLDLATIQALREAFPSIYWIVPWGLKKWFVKRNIEEKRIFEMKWWESTSIYFPEFSKSVIVHAVPAQHFSGRKIIDSNQSLWAGFVMEVISKNREEKRIYFAGDTGYNPYDFKQIGQRFKQMDLSLLPIGSYAPRKFMEPVHINPEEAVIIHKEVMSKFSIGMHWKTFHLGDEPMDRPPYDLYLAAKNNGVDPSSEFVLIHPGQYVNW